MDDNSPSFGLTPDGLVVEFMHSSVDVDYLIRTDVYNYGFKGGVHRRDPVALQPQDFVEEWLTRPSREMQSRSVPETKGMYDELHADFVLGHYDKVKPCAGRWLISLDIDHIGEKDLAKPRRTYFLVRELSKYRYRMESVSEEEPSGCPGKGISLETHPWLTPAEIRAIPKDN